MRHRLTGLPLAALASLALASTALAGAWAQVTAEGVPVDPHSGEETTVGLNVHQHGVTPVSWPSLNVIATEADSGAVVRAQAHAEGPEGSYVATIVFPSAGDWTLTFESAELEMAGSVAITVSPAAVAAQPAVSTQPGVATSADPTFDAIPLLVLFSVALLILAFASVLLRSRGVPGDSRVSVRN